MTANILDGKAIAAELRLQVAAEVATMPSPPALAVILVGNDPASEVYIKNKMLACDDVGMQSISYRLDETISEAELLALIAELNEDQQVDGILVQLPLPAHINPDHILEEINPKKDVDGFHPFNIGRLVVQKPTLAPCTAAGVMKLLEHTDITLRGQHAVIVGASNIVGRPIALQLLLADCTITVCHKYTRDLANQVQQADILIVAIGNPGVIQSAWLKPGVIVIDVGINRLDDGRLVGDVEFDSAKQIASWITPVPGGVGPMTVAMLMANTLQASKGNRP